MHIFIYMLDNLNHRSRIENFGFVGQSKFNVIIQLHKGFKKTLCLFLRHLRSTSRTEPLEAIRSGTESTARVETTSSVWLVWRRREITLKTWSWTTWRSLHSMEWWCRPATAQAQGPPPLRWPPPHWKMVRRWSRHTTAMKKIIEN